MASVSVNKVLAFDAALDKKINFTYSGNQCIANTLMVYNSATNAVIYTNRVTSFALSHTIPAGTLTNGVSYYAKITAHYMNGAVEESVTSVSSNIFTCLATPTWEFNGIANNSIINNATLQILMQYEQEQGDELNEFYVEVYNYGHVLYYRSEAQLDLTNPVEVSGLSDNTTYYLRAYGTTVSGLAFDTRTTYPDDVLITIDYIAPEIYSLAYLDNLSDSGSIRVSLNVASVEGKSASGKDFTFTKGEYINLEDDMVIFDENVYMEDEFTFLLRGKNFEINTDIMVITAADGGNVITVQLREAIISGETLYYAELRCSHPDVAMDYVIYTERMAIDLASDLQIMVWYKGGYFSIELAEVAT